MKGMQAMAKWMQFVNKKTTKDFMVDMDKVERIEIGDNGDAVLVMRGQTLERLYVTQLYSDLNQILGAV
jgi:hypothetical protein